MTVYGGFWRRAVAFLIDQAILAAIALYLFILGLMAVMAGSGSADVLKDLFMGRSTETTEPFLIIFSFTTIFCAFIYFTYFVGYAGQTPGKMLMGLHVIQVTGGRMNYRLAFFRWIGYIVSALVFYLGFIWIIFDKRKQGWHDKLAGSAVLYAPRTLIIPLPSEPGEPPESKEQEIARDQEHVLPGLIDRGEFDPSGKTSGHDALPKAEEKIP